MIQSKGKPDLFVTLTFNEFDVLLKKVLNVNTGINFNENVVNMIKLFIELCNLFINVLILGHELN